MIKNYSSDNHFNRGINVALITIAIGLIYLSTLLRKDAYLILGITFALYGLLRFAQRMFSGISVDKLERILFITFVLLSLIPISYGVWQWMIHTQIIGR